MPGWSGNASVWKNSRNAKRGLGGFGSANTTVLPHVPTLSASAEGISATGARPQTRIHRTADSNSLSTSDAEHKWLKTGAPTLELWRKWFVRGKLVAELLPTGTLSLI